MKPFRNFRFFFSVLLMAPLIAVAGFGCATARARNTESLLSAAGFHTVRPSTPQQKACFDALPPYRVERTEKEGKVVYAFADKKTGLLYLGSETEYQRFHQLGLQQRIADEQLQAAQMNQDAANSWAWGPPGIGRWW